MRCILFIGCLLFSSVVFSQDTTSYSQREIIYGRRDGMALTMTILTPKKSNGKAIVSLNSGGWVSSLNWQNDYMQRSLPFVYSGYTVFLTMHSSGPRYAIPDAFEDVQRAIQYVRFNASVYHIDKDYIGITGTSSGGHLALLAATANDIATTNSKDPVERVSSRVQAVAVFSPPTDFLNFGQTGFNPAMQKQLLQQMDLLGAFKFTKWDSTTNLYQVIENENELLQMDSLMSPAEMVTSDDAPTFIMHGDKDNVVPLQQSQLMEQKLKAADVPVILTVKPGAGHGWKNMNDDEKEFIKWFDKYLLVNK
ncbi:MAG: alpha/beta hydrolase [Chitinophagaceae bacterium]